MASNNLVNIQFTSYMKLNEFKQEESLQTGVMFNLVYPQESILESLFFIFITDIITNIEL